MPNIKRAVVIGINDYKDQSIQTLSGAVHDATEMRKILVENGGFQIKDDHFLTDKNATCARIRSAISDLFWSTDETDIALFYFSGHGLRDPYEFGYLLPHDAEKARPFVNSVRIQELKAIFAMGPPETTRLMVLDCCYSGIATEGVKAAAIDDLESFNREVSLSDQTGSGRFILASADADSTAREEERDCPFGGGRHVHGQFTYHLIEGLSTLGSAETFHQISLDALIKHMKLTKGTRNPQLNAFGASLDDIVLTRNPERHQRELEDRIREIERLPGKKQMDLTVAALNKMEELRNKRLLPSETDRLSKVIDDYLQGCTGPLAEWWWDNMNAHSRASGCEFYETLREIILDLDVEHLRALPEGVRARTGSVFQQILAGKPADFVATLIAKVRVSDSNTDTKGGIRPNPIGPKTFSSKSLIA